MYSEKCLKKLKASTNNHKGNSKLVPEENGNHMAKF